MKNALQRVMADQAFLDSLVRLGVDPVTDSDPDKAAAMLRAEITKWRPFIVSLGLRN